MSRIEDRLLEQIAKTTIQHDRVVATARLAIYYFHKGEYGRATALVDSIRGAQSATGNLEAMVYVNLAEATLLHQSGNGDDAALKAKRAHALSTAAQRRDLVSLSGIWLAHLEFNRGNYANCISLLGAAAKTIEVAPLLARTRLNMLVGDLLTFCGREPLASRWYSLARASAIEEGDEVAIGQIIFNAAAFGFNNVRVVCVRGQEIEEQIRFIELMIASSSNYDVGVGSSAFESLLPMLNAQLLLLRRKYEDSAKIFSRWLGSPDAAIDARLRTTCGADYALALAHIGAQDEAIRQLVDVERVNIDELPPDEAAIVLCQLSTLYAALGDSERATELRTRSIAEIVKHESIQKQIFEHLNNEFLASTG
jgi:tetratricopeptide (TPR) repeat protein